MCVETIVVRTTCVETGWHGGCERSTPTCSQAQINQIGAALCAIMGKVEGCGLRGLDGLKNCLLSASRSVVWRCGATSNPNAVASSSGSEITLTPTAFSSTAARFEAIVFHELIHHCGGTELDAEAFENHCYRGNGATAPTSGDFPKFRDDGGNFVTWDPVTGRVDTTSGERLNINESAFVDPSPPTGGGDGWV